MARIILIPILIGVLLCGCNARTADAPSLRLTIKREHHSSTGTFRVTHTGVISESKATGDSGKEFGERVLVDKITSDGIDLTIELSDSTAEIQRLEIFVPYGEETKRELAGGGTVTASATRKR